LAITFELPQDIESSLRAEFADLDSAAKEAALVELYRQHKLTHHELSKALGLSRFDTDAVLKSHGVYYEMTLEQIRRESDSIGPKSNS